MNTRAMGKNIQKRLIDIDMSRHDLAAAIGLTEATLSRYISGKRQPTAYALFRMARAMDTSMEYLMQGVE